MTLNLARRLGLLGAIVAIGLLLAATHASTAGAYTIAYSNLGYPEVNATDCSATYGPYSWCKSGGPLPYRSTRLYDYRNCTDYVAWKEATLGVTVPTNLQNGGQWYDNAPASERSSSPLPWDAAVQPGNPGHVAFVESVNSDGTITVSEYNYDGQGDGDTRTGTASSMGFTEFVDFGVHPPSGGGSSTPNSLRIAGDFDGNGKSDIAIVTPMGAQGINIVPALSNGSSFLYGGVWRSDPGLTLGGFGMLAGDFNGDGKTDLAVVTPAGASGINIVPLLSTGSNFLYGGVWYYDTGTVFTNSQIYVGDFNGDGKSDILLVTPRQGSGINVVPLISTGSAFVQNSPWYVDTGLNFGQYQFVIGDFNGDGKDDIANITPAGASGINIVPLLSTGSNFLYGGVWYYDTGTVFTDFQAYEGDFNNDGKDDILLVTPMGSVGINLVPLMSTGSTFIQNSPWYTDPGLTFGAYQFVIGDFDGSNGQDVGAITPRGAAGINIVPWLSNGVNAFNYTYVWYQDTGTVF